LQFRRFLSGADIRQWHLSRLEDRGLIGGGKESAVEVVQSTRRNQTAVQDDEPGQILALTPQAISQPGSHAGAALQATSRMKEVVRIGVLGKIGRHRSDNGQVINMLGHAREQVADRNSRFAIRAEFPRARQRRADIIELSWLDLHRKRFAVLLVQPRLRIERIDLGWSPIHIEEDDVLDASRKVRGARSERTGIGTARPPRIIACTLFPPQRGERQSTEAKSSLAQHSAT
jgi:hypothetical protein